MFIPKFSIVLFLFFAVPVISSAADLKIDTAPTAEGKKIIEQIEALWDRV